MTFSLFILFFISTVLLSVTFLTLANSKRLVYGADTSNKAGLGVVASVVLGWILLQTASSNTYFPFKDFVFGFYPFLIIMCGLSMYAIQKGNFRRFWIYLAACFISVCFIPENSFVFQGFLPLFFDRFFTAILWALFIVIYTKLDKVENLTTTQTTAMCLALSLFPLAAVRYGIVISSFFSYYPLIVLASIIGFMTYKKQHTEVSLGKTGSVPLGYLMGFFLIFLATKGFWMAALIMPAYYYFEIIYSLCYRLIHRKNPQPLAFSFFISYAIRSSLNPRGILALLLLTMVGFGLTGIIFNNSFQMMLILTGMLFFYVIYRFLHWNQAKVTYRTMFKDTVDVFKVIYNNSKKTLIDVHDTLAEKNKK